MNVWRVNVREQSVVRVETPPTWERLGGRALVARILLDEVPGDLRAVGPAQQTDFRPGLAGGAYAVLLRPHLGRRQEPAHRRRQGSQRRRLDGLRWRCWGSKL